MSRPDGDPITRGFLIAGWLAGILALGLLAAHAGATGSRNALMLVVAAVGTVALMAFFASHVDLLHGVAFALLPAAGLMIPGLDLPLNEVLLTASFLVALIQGRRNHVRIPTIVTVVLSILLAMMVISAAVNQSFGAPVMIRLGHIALYGGIVVVLTMGMIPRDVVRRALLVGLGVFSTISLLLFLSGRSTTYAGRLSGPLGDPNTAAYAILVLGAVAIGVVPAGWRRNGVIALLSVPFVLTQSRGAFAAAAFCLLWWLVGRRLRLPAGLSLLGVGALAVTVLPTTVQQAGIFASRSGSDALRANILTRSLQAAQSGFWLGNGPGSTRVRVYGSYNFFFHNSYLAIVSEGGIVAAIALVGLIVLAFAQLVRLPLPLREPGLEIALVGALVASLHLGEVLLNLPTAAAVGLALGWAGSHRLQDATAQIDRSSTPLGPPVRR